MASVLFSNNASAALASSITTSSTTITVTTGAGAQFPAISVGNYFYATLTDSSNNLEIVKVTARATDVLTVVRAQEGTTARAYAAADKLELRVTAAALTEYVTLAITDAISATKQALYPVGSIYTNSSVATNPASLLGFGTWVAFGSGRTIVSQDGSTFTAGATGGSADAIVVNHTHSASSSFSGTALGAHSHTGTTATGGSHVHTYKTYGLGNSGLLGNGNNNSDWGWASTGNPAGTAEGSHNHSFTTDNASAGTPAGSVSTSITATGASATGANLPPYVVVYMWQRTA